MNQDGHGLKVVPDVFLLSQARAGLANAPGALNNHMGENMDTMCHRNEIQVKENEYSFTHPVTILGALKMFS